MPAADEVGPATLSNDFRAVRSFYAWLAEEGDIIVNPALGLRGPKVPETPVPVADEVTYKRLLRDDQAEHACRDPSPTPRCWRCCGTAASVAR